MKYLLYTVIIVLSLIASHFVVGKKLTVTLWIISELVYCILKVVYAQ